MTKPELVTITIMSHQVTPPLDQPSQYIVPQIQCFFFVRVHLQGLRGLPSLKVGFASLVLKIRPKNAEKLEGMDHLDHLAVP